MTNNAELIIIIIFSPRDNLSIILLLSSLSSESSKSSSDFLKDKLIFVLLKFSILQINWNIKILNKIIIKYLIKDYSYDSGSLKISSKYIYLKLAVLKRQKKKDLIQQFWFQNFFHQ